MSEENNLEKALKKLRKDKDIPGTPAHRFYSMLSTADPKVLGFLEHQVALAYSAGTMIGESLKEKGKTASGRKELRQMLERISQGTSSKGSRFSHKEPEEES